MRSEAISLGRAFLLAATVPVLTACATGANPGRVLQQSDMGYNLTERAAPSAHNGSKWKVLLAAVGNEQTVFDRFVQDFAQQLTGPDIESIATLSAKLRRGPQVANERNLLRTADALRPAPGRAV